MEFKYHVFSSCSKECSRGVSSPIQSSDDDELPWVNLDRSRTVITIEDSPPMDTNSLPRCDVQVRGYWYIIRMSITYSYSIQDGKFNYKNVIVPQRSRVNIPRLLYVNN